MIDRDRWLRHLENLKRRGEAQAQTASDSWCQAYRKEIVDALNRMPGREHWLERLSWVTASPYPYTYDPRFQDETGEEPPDSRTGGKDVVAIKERYAPWVRSRWTRDHCAFLDELIDSEKGSEALGNAEMAPHMARGIGPSTRYRPCDTGLSRGDGDCGRSRRPAHQVTLLRERLAFSCG